MALCSYGLQVLTDALTITYVTAGGLSAFALVLVVLRPLGSALDMVIILVMAY